MPETLPAPPVRKIPLHTSESQSMVRTRQFPAKLDISTIEEELRNVRATGTLMIDFNEGGRGSIRFREEHKF